MQTLIVENDFYLSASRLDTKRLGANIYESIQILASLLDCTDKLVNPKRNVKNCPQAKLWAGYEQHLLFYISAHLYEWLLVRHYKADISKKNLKILRCKIDYSYTEKPCTWITPELIQTHRSVLIQKKPDYYKKFWPDTPDNLNMRYDFRKDV